MPQGLQVWDASGRLVMDYTDRVVRIQAQVVIGPGNPSGSIDVPALVEGDFIYFFNSNLLDGFPTVGVSGTTVTWTQAANTVNWSGTLLIGTY